MSKVFFSKTITPQCVKEIFECLNPSKVIKKNDFTAIKIHFGEKGNLGYIKPHFVKPIVETVKSLGARPFLTDANTIYVGSRANAIEHTEVALKHGFTIENVGAPVIIADGLRGNAGNSVRVDLKHFKTVLIANAIHYADSIVFMTHFKGHEISGFGGAIKNAGMGCATREGKYQQHNSVVPQVSIDLCTGCGGCMKWCPSDALSLNNGVISLDDSKCVGCGECILSCQFSVFDIPWNDTTSNVQEKMVEYAYGVIKNKRSLYLNFLNFITKFCDCYETKEKPYFDEVGILASDDPVAIDRASVDIINKKYGRDFFRYIFPSIDWRVQLNYAERLGLGKQEYELIEL